MKFEGFGRGVLLVMLFSMFVLHSRSAAFSAPKQKVVGIEVEGLTTISVAEFLGKVKIKEGDVFSEEEFKKAVAEDIVRLARDRMIVSVSRRRVPEGIVVVFAVVAENVLPELEQVRFEGWSASDLADIVRVRRGSKFVEHVLKADERRIREFLIGRGYARAVVETTVDPVEPGRVALTFVVSRGPKFQLRKLEFVGNETLGRKELVKVMGTKVDRFLTSRTFVMGIFKDDITRLNDLYRSRGYFDAIVELDKLTMDSETGRVEAVIKVIEGPRYRIEEVRFEGNEAVSDAVLLSIIALRPGALYSLEALRSDVARIQRYYTSGKRGYALAETQHRVEGGEQPATIKLTFLISEGRRTYIRRIDTRGNYKTRKKVIVREMRLEPGDLYDSELIENSRLRLLDLQYFTDVHIEHRPAPPPKIGAVEGADYVDLVVEVEETETGRLLVGAGYNTNSALVGQISLEQRNFDIGNLPDFKRYGIAALNPDRCFIGGGQRLRLTAEPGSERNRYYFEFEEPWLFDYPVEFLLSGYLFERFYDGYTVDRRGGTVALGKRFTRQFKINVQYRREEVKIGDIDATSPVDAAREKGTHDLGAWRISARYDTRDNRLFPTKGGSYGTYAELAGVPAGGNVNFWKYGLDGSIYLKLWELPSETPHVLRLSAEGGFAGPAFGDDDVPIYERFFAGGIGSLRGFAFRGIGPRQTVPPTGNTALGGDFLFLGTGEYIIPLYKRDLQGYIFTDVGTVSSSIRADAFDDLRVSVGFGFRYVLPVWGRIPLTINFGFPVQEEPGDETQTFTFALGLFF